MVESCSIKNLPEKSKVFGIGEYQDASFSTQNKLAVKVAKIGLMTLLSLASIASVVVVAVVSPYFLIATVPLSLALTGATIHELVRTIRTSKLIKNIAPSTSCLKYDTKMEKCPKNFEWSDKIEGMAPLADTIETFQVKKELIENAEQEILISGSYCGREAFDIVLDAIEQRMEKKPELRTHILSATRFITDQDKFNSKNWKKIKNLTKKFPDRFFCELSFETAQSNVYDSGFKYVSNHMKLMVVDRKVMITGGSGIEDRWMKYDGLNKIDESDPSLGPSEGLVNSAIARGFRDKDFLFYSENEESPIQTSVFEFYKLFSRWHHFGATRKKNHRQLKEIARNRGKHQLKAWHDFYNDLKDSGGKIELSNLQTNIKLIKPARTKIFATGPEMKNNQFGKEILERLNSAKKSIVINHMYIHPTKKISTAINRALKRGVKVTVITNGNIETSPGSHKIFGARTIYNIRKFAKRIGTKIDNYKVYLWNKKNVTNHQKVIIVDSEYLFCGSSNFGYKGLVSMSDYEHNVLVQSKEVCESLEAGFEEEIAACKELSSKDITKSPSLKEYFTNKIHEFLQHKIG